MIREKLRLLPVLAVGVAAGISLEARDTQIAIYDSAINAGEDAFEGSAGVNGMLSAGIITRSQNEVGQTIYRYNPSAPELASYSYDERRKSTSQFSEADKAFHSTYREAKAQPGPFLTGRITYDQAETIDDVAFAGVVALSLLTVINEATLGQPRQKA